MAQSVLPYKYEEENTGSGMTALAGLPLYLNLMSVFDVGTSIANHPHVKERRWTDGTKEFRTAVLEVEEWKPVMKNIDDTWSNSPFPTMKIDTQDYRVFGIVTNGTSMDQTWSSGSTNGAAHLKRPTRS